MFEAWKSEGADGLVYAVSVAEMERLAYAGFKDARGGQIIPRAFQGSGELAHQKVRAVLAAASEKWGNLSALRAGTSVQVAFGHDIGWDPVGLVEPVSRVFYVSDEAAWGLCEASNEKPKATRLLSCEMRAPASMSDLPEEMRSDVELALAMLEGRLRLVQGIRAGMSVMPNGSELPPVLKWGSVGARLLAGASGFACSKRTMERVNLALWRMQSPPPEKAVRELALKLDAQDRLKADRPQAKSGAYACLAIDVAQVGSARKALSHYCDSAVDALAWARDAQSCDGEVRLGSETGAVLASRAWRRAKDDGLSVAQYLLSPEEACLNPVNIAELLPTLGKDSAFDQAWEAFRVSGGTLRQGVEREPEAAKAVRVKPRTGGSLG